MPRGFGVSESVFDRAGLGVTGAVGSGPYVREFSRTGFATAGGVASGPTQSDHIRTGFATVGAVGTGASVRGPAVYMKAGVAKAGGLVGAGVSESVFVDRGHGGGLVSFWNSGTPAPGGVGMGTGGSNQRLGQSFQHCQDLTVTDLKLLIGTQGAPTDNLIVEIQTDSAGIPSGTVLGSHTITGSSLSNTRVFVSVAGGTIANLALPANTSYWIVIRRSGALDAANAYSWEPATVYADGVGRTFNGTVWSLQPRDFLFTLSYYQPSVVAAGSRIRELSRTGLATVGGVGSGVSQKVSGAGNVYTKTGFATIGGVGAGPSSSDEFSSGLAVIGLVGAGSSASVFVETGFATLGGVGAGFVTRLGVQTKTGFATVGGVSSGGRALLRLRGGYATIGLAAAGPNASVTAETGFATAGGVGAGSSARVLGGIVKSGFAAAGLTARGARAVSRARSGVGIAGLTAAGARRVVYVETGYAVIEGTSTGIRQVSRVRIGSATVGLIGSGVEFLPGRQPLPPGQIVPPILGHIPAGLMPRIEQARTGRPAGPGRGTIITGKGGSADG